MKNISIYQCIPAYKPMATTRIIKSIISNCRILLDLEDGIQDVQNPALSRNLKYIARNDFEIIVKNLKNHKVSLRINPVKSNEYKYDKSLLHKYSDNIESVFLPKIEDADDLRIFENEFGAKFRLNLIIESQKGIDNLDKILYPEIIGSIDYVFFGNYDYHLDRKIFPIREQNSEAYWEIVSQISSIVEKYNLGFGNSPYTNIADKKTLELSIKRLAKVCKQEFAVMSLHKAQTQYYVDLLSDLNCDKQIFYNGNLESVTVQDFISNRQKNRSFAFLNKRIITPQEYLLMKLMENGDN